MNAAPPDVSLHMFADDDSNKRKRCGDGTAEEVVPAAKRQLSPAAPPQSSVRQQARPSPQLPPGFDQEDLLRQQEEARSDHEQEAEREWQCRQQGDRTGARGASSEAGNTAAPLPLPPSQQQSPQPLQQRRTLSPRNSRLPAAAAASRHSASDSAAGAAGRASATASPAAPVLAPASAPEMRLPLPEFANLKVMNAADR